MSYNKKGIVSTNDFSTIGCTLDMETKILSDGSCWGKIFEQNSKSGTVLFSSEAEVTKCVNNSDKYSRLYLINNLKGSDGKFEFMLCYPDDTELYNRWKQTSNPLEEYLGTSDASLTATGYEAVTIAWNSNYWGGLTRQVAVGTAPTNCVLSGGTGHSNWFFAIGTVISYQSGIPSYGTVTTGRVQLWIRLDNISNVERVKMFSNCVVTADIYEV